jgi:large subunit ribosomal protein L35
MPKMKTNRTVYKKLKVGGSGRVKRSKAYTSHNTAKKTRKRIRNLRKMVTVDDTNMNLVKRQLPYMKRH